MTAPPLALQVSLAAFVLALVAALTGQPASFAWLCLLSTAALDALLIMLALHAMEVNG